MGKLPLEVEPKGLTPDLFVYFFNMIRCSESDEAASGCLDGIG